jgi:DNA topoisomerase IB
VGTDAAGRRQYRYHAEQHGTFGVATLRKEHVRVRAGELIFDYPAKGSIPRNVVIADAELVEVIGELHRQDFRTWSATVAAAAQLATVRVEGASPSRRK